MVHRHKWEYSLEVVDIDKEFKLERPPWGKEIAKPKTRTCRSCGEVQELRTVMRLGMILHFYIDTMRLPMDTEELEKKRKMYTRLSYILALFMIGFVLWRIVFEPVLVIDLQTIVVMFVLFGGGSWFIFNRLFKYEFEEEAYVVKNPWCA